MYKNNIKSCVTNEVQKDNNTFPIIKVAYLEKEANVVSCEQYGTHGSPPVGTVGLLFTLNNDESNRIMIPMSSQTRTRDLEENEFECGNFVIGSIITFDKDGNITIEGKKDININAVNDININAGSNDINVTGDIHVTGAIDTTGDVVAGAISLQTHVHTGVMTGGSNTGGPV